MNPILAFRMCVRTIALVGLMAVGCVACVPSPVRQSSGDGTTGALSSVGLSSDASEILAFHDRIRGLGPADLARETESARGGLGRGAQGVARMRLAVLLATPGNPARDEVRAIAMADALRTEPGGASEDLRRLAGVLRHFWADQKRGFDAVGGQQADVRKLSEQNAAQAAEIKRLQDALLSSEKKLEAVKAIEKSLSEREAHGKGATR